MSRSTAFPCGVNAELRRLANAGGGPSCWTRPEPAGHERLVSGSIASMKVNGRLFAILGALLVTSAAWAAEVQGVLTSNTAPRTDRRSDEPPLSDERKAHLLAVLHDAWRNKDIDRRRYDQSVAWVNSSPCSGIDRSLTPQAQRQLESAIANEQHRAQVAVSDIFRSKGWSIVYTDASDGDEPYLFYSRSPEQGAHPVTIWSGGGAIFETTDIARQVMKDAPGIPPKLAECFAWHVTLNLD